MKAAGIITELNPFHSGHAHLIREARRLSGADFVVTVMSGDFVQRGEPAVFDKYTRTRQALEGGADLVFELPVRFCLSSAGDFALGGILALSSLGFVNDLYFGSECGELEPLMQTAEILYQESSEGHTGYSLALQSALKHGLSYPAARAHAMSQVTSVAREILEEPNNILGIEYCHALLKLNSSIVPHTIPREGQHYNDGESFSPNGGHPSATALRRQIYLSETPHLCLEDCSEIIGYALLREDDLTKYKDISPDLAARIKKGIDSYRDITGFVRDCQTRTFTESRIRRALLQCALGLTGTSVSMPYLRILGMKKKAGVLIRSTPDTLQILTNLSSDERQLDNTALDLLSKDILASDWYRQMWHKKYEEKLPNEYQRSVIVL